MINSQTLQQLAAKGIRVPDPPSVYIADDVNLERLGPGSTLYPGCQLYGAETSIGPGCELGTEGPVVLRDCQLGQNVQVGGGFLYRATLLDGVRLGFGAHIREGTLLEEVSGAAHCAAFKQTIFMPYVIGGSLLNFCDCLMAGGTSRQNHSEIGSSYVHFNFTPHQDKATPSLIGDVPRGVMLDQPPIFLGGQGGLVGPARIEFGVVIPAGVICRDDVLTPAHLFLPEHPPPTTRPFRVGAYRSIQRIVQNNLRYIGNLWALKQWYVYVRRPMMERSAFGAYCWAGAMNRLEEAIAERIKRLGELAARMPESVRIATTDPHFSLPERVLVQQKMLHERWPHMEETLRAGPPEQTGATPRQSFIRAWETHARAQNYLGAIAALPSEVKASGTAWLDEIVSWAVHLWPTS